MSTPSPSRSAFAAPGQPSLADFIARIQGDPALSQTTRQNWAWALRALCRAAKAEPDLVAAHPEALRRLFAKAAPAATGLSVPAWNNVRSLAGKALAWAGVTSIPGHYQAPYKPAWAELWAKLPTGTA